MNDLLTPEEYALLRQAAYNQRDDERREAEAVECRLCRAGASETARLRALTRERGLKKIEPKVAA